MRVPISPVLDTGRLQCCQSCGCEMLCRIILVCISLLLTDQISSGEIVISSIRVHFDVHVIIK